MAKEGSATAGHSVRALQPDGGQGENNRSTGFITLEKIISPPLGIFKKFVANTGYFRIIQIVTRLIGIGLAIPILALISNLDQGLNPHGSWSINMVYVMAMAYTCYEGIVCPAFLYEMTFGWWMRLQKFLALVDLLLFVLAFTSMTTFAVYIGQTPETPLGNEFITSKGVFLWNYLVNDPQGRTKIKVLLCLCVLLVVLTFIHFLFSLFLSQLDWSDPTPTDVPLLALRTYSSERWRVEKPTLTGSMVHTSTHSNIPPPATSQPKPAPQSSSSSVYSQDRSGSVKNPDSGLGSTNESLSELERSRQDYLSRSQADIPHED